ncbi:uncharacterized protein DS421_19g645630 [Arachis hypogaea]|uniref:Aminotransferase-like plant mobile domain-containing protein n=1 Tax=Arachis hypogaea TaxID=3818 RepID=A0A6B9V5N6_ARAHY|nr:uncharacterized protein DS421_19g645630 [Arachis hypogaea]
MLQPTRCIYSVRRQQNMPLHDRIVPYLERAGLYHLARLNARWFWLDEPLVSAFIERWRPETHTFHMPFGEYTITLQDVAYQLGLPWMVYLYPGALQILRSLWKKANRRGRGFRNCLASFHHRISYSWGSAALAWLYRCMCQVANRNVTNLAGPLQLLQSWIFWQFSSLRPQGFDTYSFPLASGWATYLPTFDHKEERVIQCCLALDCLGDRDIVWETYASLDVMAVVHPEILTEEHSRLWCACTCLIYFAIIEWHQMPDPGPSADFLRWWYRVAHRFLSLDSLIADPRAEEINQVLFREGRHRRLLGFRCQTCLITGASSDDDALVPRLQSGSGDGWMT